MNGIPIVKMEVFRKSIHWDSIGHHFLDEFVVVESARKKFVGQQVRRIDLFEFENDST